MHNEIVDKINKSWLVAKGRNNVHGYKMSGKSYEENTNKRSHYAK